MKLKVIQTLLEPCDRATYGKRLREAAEKLGKSKRTVQRLVKKWEEEGLAGLTQNKRSDRLEQMLPPKGVGMKLSPIRLCAACYVENPCHQIEWQFKQTDRCHKHQLRLLSECPNCKARFQIPSMWIDPWCHRCFLPCGEMVKYHKPI